MFIRLMKLIPKLSPPPSPPPAQTFTNIPLHSSVASTLSLVSDLSMDVAVGMATLTKAT